MVELRYRAQEIHLVGVVEAVEVKFPGTDVEEEETVLDVPTVKMTLMSRAPAQQLHEDDPPEKVIQGMMHCDPVIFPFYHNVRSDRANIARAQAALGVVRDVRKFIDLLEAKARELLDTEE